MNSDDMPKREEIYAETRRDLLTRQLSNSERFDGAVLTLSSGALGLSLAFIKDIVPLCKAQWRPLLIASWVLLVLAIFSTMVSFLASQKGIKTQLRYARKYYLEKRDEFLTKQNRWAKATECFNCAAGALFVFAAVLTVAFVIKNV